MCGLPQGHTSILSEGAHTTLSLPIFEYGIKRKKLRISEIDVVGCDWSTGQGWWPRGHQLPPPDWNHPSLPQDHGERHRAFPDGRHIHYPKDIIGRIWLELFVSNCREIPRSKHSPEQHGYLINHEQAFHQITQAHHQVLQSTHRKSESPACSFEEHAWDREGKETHR